MISFKVLNIDAYILKTNYGRPMDTFYLIISHLLIHINNIHPYIRRLLDSVEPLKKHKYVIPDFDNYPRQ